MTLIYDAHVGDIGLDLVVTLYDRTELLTTVGTATVLKLIFKKPGGEVIERDAALVTDGTDGKVHYVTVAGDLDRAGTWSVQGYLEMPGWTGRTKVDTFPVGGNL